MVILKSSLLNQFPEIIFGFSTKFGLKRKPPFNFNMSLSVGDNQDTVLENRSEFFDKLGLHNKCALQKQIHGDTVTIVSQPGSAGESDAMITSEKGLGLAVSTADCTPIFVFDNSKKIIAGIHSGWRSTEKRITLKTIQIMKKKFSSKAEDLFVYIGPSISQKNYEVGKDFENKFDEKYLKPSNGKYLLDVKKVNFDQLLESGIPERNIQISELCSYEIKNILNSYRREGEVSGRSFGVIAMRERTSDTVNRV